MSRSPRSVFGLALLLLVVTFSAGMLVGARLRSSDSDLSSQAPAPVLMEMGTVIEQLGLDDNQTQRVRVVLAQRSTQTNLIMEEAGSRLSIIADSLSAEIKNVLTSDQRMLYDSLIADQRSRIRLRRPQGSNPR